MARGKTNTRGGGEIWGLGPGLTPDDAVLNSSRVPTNRQVLRCMLYEQSQPPPPATTLLQVAQRVLPRVKKLYKVELITDIKACQKLVSLVLNSKKIKKVPVGKRKDSEQVKKKLEKKEISQSIISALESITKLP